MTDEAIIADELDVQESTDSDVEDWENDTEKELLRAELERERAEKAKWESRYKSNMKKQATQVKEPKETKPEKEKEPEVDLDSLVEKKLYAIEEQREFIKQYGEDVFNEIKKIKDKHPTLSLRDAYKISPVANDQASKEEPSTMSMWGRPNAKTFSDSKSISMSELVKLDKTAYRIMRDRISKWEIALKS